MNFWLALHIIAAGTWLGCNVAQVVMGTRISSAGTEVRAWWSDAGEFLGKAVYPAAGALILITGLIMVITSNDPGGYSFASAFVSIGFVAVVIGGVLGGVVFGPKNRAAGEAIRAGDAAAESKARSTILNFAYLDTAIVVFTIFMMVYKVGAKYKGL